MRLLLIALWVLLVIPPAFAAGLDGKWRGDGVAEFSGKTHSAKSVLFSFTQTGARLVLNSCEFTLDDAPAYRCDPYVFGIRSATQLWMGNQLVGTISANELNANFTNGAFRVSIQAKFAGAFAVYKFLATGSNGSRVRLAANLSFVPPPRD